MPTDCPQGKTRWNFNVHIITEGESGMETGEEGGGEER